MRMKGGEKRVWGGREKGEKRKKVREGVGIIGVWGEGEGGGGGVSWV